MKFIKLVLAAALLQPLASYAQAQNGAQARARDASRTKEIIQQAEQGDAFAQSSLGILYRRGQGVPQDHAQAVKWFRKAAEQGDAGAQISLGYAYRDGEGVPQDHAQAVNWFRKAAVPGSDVAQYLLGEAYIEGEGVPQDFVLAYAWLNLASSQGSKFSRTRRDMAAEKFSPSELAEAQRQSSNWQKGQSIQREKR